MMILVIAIAAVLLAAILDGLISYKGSRSGAAYEGHSWYRERGTMLFSPARYILWNAVVFAPFLALGIVCLKYGSAALYAWAVGPAAIAAEHIIQVLRWKEYGAKL